MKHCKQNNTQGDRLIVRVPITRTMRLTSSQVDYISALQTMTLLQGMNVNNHVGQVSQDPSCKEQDEIK